MAYLGQLRPVEGFQGIGGLGNVFLLERQTQWSSGRRHDAP